jgi:hypothetical protein
MAALTIFPLTESFSLSAELRAPGRLGVNFTSAWQVFGGEPGPAAVNAPVQVVLAML